MRQCLSCCAPLVSSYCNYFTVYTQKFQFLGEAITKNSEACNFFLYIINYCASERTDEMLPCVRMPDVL